MRFVNILAAATVAAIAMPWGAAPVVAQQTYSQTVSCSSAGRGRTECPVDGEIVTARQTAASAGGFCIPGFSWGYEDSYIWVDAGCGGTFEAETLRQDAAGGRPDRETFTETLDCRSSGSRREKCKVKGRIESVEPVGTFTSAPCREGESWGYEKRHIWVDGGCEARFNVTFSRRDGKPAPKPDRKPEPQVVNDTSSSGSLADAPLSAIVAQGACSGLYPSLGKGGYVFAVPRRCSASAPDCSAVCNGVRDTVEGQGNWPKILDSRRMSCFNSLHVYGSGAGNGPGAAATRTYVYNDCGGSCGPNFCCCSAE